MKLAKLHVRIDLSNRAWIEKWQGQDGERLTCGEGLEENFDESCLDRALDELEKGVLE